LPHILEKVAPDLDFRAENRIIHIAAGIKVEKAAPWFAPARSIVRSVPLPFASRRFGPIILYGSDPVSEDLLSHIGSIVKVKTEKEMEILAVVTGLMVSYYGLVGEIVTWCMEKGLDFQSALEYTNRMNESLSILMRTECTEDIEAFLIENSTPGGTNEFALRYLREKHAFDPWKEAMEIIGKRYDL